MTAWFKFFLVTLKNIDGVSFNLPFLDAIEYKLYRLYGNFIQLNASKQSNNNPGYSVTEKKPILQTKLKEVFLSFHLQ